MQMKFMRKDINKRLLVLVIVLLVLLTSFTIYYAVAFTNLLNRFNKNQEIFGELTANAIIDQFNKTSVQTYKDYLERRYNDLSTVNQKLKDEVINLKSEIIVLKSQLEYQKAKDVGPTEQFRLFQSKNDEISRLNGKVKELCSELEAHNTTSKDCVGIS